MCKQTIIGTRIEDTRNFLKSIVKTRSVKKRCRLLKGATFNELLSLVEICYNILRSRFALSPRQKSKLLPHAAFIRKLGGVRSEQHARYLVQKGAGFPYSALIKPILLEATRQGKIKK